MEGEKLLAFGSPLLLFSEEADTRTGELLGCHLVGHSVTELLGELSLARTLEATTASLGYTVHAHPSLAEAVKEAALSARGEVIHVWQG